MELNVLMRSKSPYIVTFYGSFFRDLFVSYGMEYMDGGSLDKLHTDGTAEPIMSKIAFAVKEKALFFPIPDFLWSQVVSGLKYLKEELNVIHRDVKPTNVLVNLRGEIKLCDFGISGQLVQSLAYTALGCQPYMAVRRTHNSQPNASLNSLNVSQTPRATRSSQTCGVWVLR